jgi:hypothetical protein
MSTAHWQARRLPVPAACPARSSPAARPWAIVSAGLAPILLTGAYLIAGILQPASYSPVRTTISAMAGQAGTDRWVMTGGIFLTGGCYLVTATGLTGVREQDPAADPRVRARRTRTGATLTLVRPGAALAVRDDIPDV